MGVGPLMTSRWQHDTSFDKTFFILLFFLGQCFEVSVAGCKVSSTAIF